MKVTVLVDNNTLIDRYYLGEPGLSFFIETEGKKILFDVGYSDVFLRNAYLKGISLEDLDYVVISHAHLDHTWGFDALIKVFTELRFEKREHKKPTLIAHPEIFLSRAYDNGEEFGMLTGQEMLGRYFDLRLTKEPLQITKNLFFLGEIPRLNDFEAKKAIGKILVAGDWQEDFILDDSALAYRSQDGLVILTGCSHAGICNIIEHAREVCKENRVLDVVGGFHLQQPTESHLEGTRQYFARLQPSTLHACHCTDLQSKIALSSVAAVKEVGSGMELKYPDTVEQ